jgi:hypothetical protein
MWIKIQSNVKQQWSNRGFQRQNRCTFLGGRTQK